jgi:hypothetical protein
LGIRSGTGLYTFPSERIATNGEYHSLVADLYYSSAYRRLE